MAGQFGRLLTLFGLAMVAVGLLIQFGPSLPLLGKLPGDLRLEWGGFRLYLPLATCLVISVVLTLLLQLFARLK
jgi:hypothetical protein